MADNPVDRRRFFEQGFKRVFGKAVEVIEHKVAPGRYVRPPGALPEAAFLGACTRCGECMTACPVHALLPLGSETGFASGTPVLRPDVNACVMCLDMPCASHCPTDALAVPDDNWRRVKLARITIDTGSCLRTTTPSAGSARRSARWGTMRCTWTRWAAPCSATPAPVAGSVSLHV